VVDPIIPLAIPLLHRDHSIRGKRFMGKHQPYKNIDKFLIAERSLNYILRPVQGNKDKYPYTYKVENLGSKVAVTVDRAWTFSNHLILDFIGHELFEKEYRNVDKKRNTWRNDLSQALLFNYKNLLDLKDFDIPPDLNPYTTMYEELEKLKAKNKELNEFTSEKNNALDEKKYEKCQRTLQHNDQKIAELKAQIGTQKLHDIEELARRWSSVKVYMIEFSRYKFVERYKKFFKDRRTEYLTELIKRTSEVRFSLEYPIQKPIINEYVYKGKSVSKIIKTSPEPVKIENNKIFNYKAENNKIEITFNTFLGRAYVHNLLTLNTDWFEENYLKLDGYASAIYRHFFVTRSGNKVDQLPIKSLVEYFDWSKNSRYPEVIKRAFEDIKNAGLIADYRLKNNGSKFSKGYIEVEKSSK